MCGQWYYGNLITRETDSPVPETPQAYKCVMIGDIEDGSWEEVEEETIGQYIGLLDKNGKEIYEGDILEIAEMYAKVVWNKEKASFEYEYIHPMHLTNGFYEFNMPYLSIVGNIHDNPELLKGE